MYCPTCKTTDDGKIHGLSIRRKSMKFFDIVNGWIPLTPALEARVACSYDVDLAADLEEVFITHVKGSDS